MQGAVVGGLLAVLLFVCLSSVESQFPPPYYPIKADGFETAWVDDMSFATEMHFQSWSGNFTNPNFTMFIFGSSKVRSVYPQPGTGFVVTIGPNEDWHLPFIDLHIVQNGTDLWGIGPIEPVPNVNHGQTYGYSLDVAVITTKYYQFYRDWRFSPLTFEGTFFAVRPLVIPGMNNIIGYFAGFFPNASNPFQLQFGVVRAVFNMSNDLPSNNFTQRWAINASNDVVAIVPNAQLVTFNQYYKPIIFHVWNVTGAASPNTTYTLIIDPGTLWVSQILGNFNPAVPLTLSSNQWNPSHIGLPYGGITSATLYYPGQTLILGIGTPGIGTGAIAFVNVLDLSTRGVLTLPANYSDPKALAIDEFNGTLYVAMNGGGSLLQININSMTITGYQNLPFYLLRAWEGIATFEHVYFITSEQHTKVFRLHKRDFCPSLCPFNGYCQAGSCVCSTGFEMVSGQCQWQALIVEKHTADVNKAGEIVLGVFFAITFVAGAIGWFLVWKAKRAGYQAV